MNAPVTIQDCRLRPVEEADIEMMRAWRNSDRVSAMMFSDDVITAEGQRNWFKGLRDDPDRLYLLFEVRGEAVGLIYFNPIDRQRKQATWGFYMGQERSPRGSARMMGRLALAVAFDTLGMERVIGETFVFNERSIAFHERLGFLREAVLPGYKTKRGTPQDVIRFAIEREAWKASGGRE